MYSPDPADLFAQLYDQLPRDLFADPDIETWPTDRAVVDIAAAIEGSVTEEGRLDPLRIDELVDVDEPAKHRYAILRGIDQAFDNVQWQGATYDESQLVVWIDRYIRSGRLSTSEIEGGVIPRYVSPAQEHYVPESNREAFTSVIRVPKESWDRAAHVVLDGPYDLSRLVRQQGLFVGCVAFASDIDELDIRPEGDGRYYSVLLRDHAVTLERVPRVLAALDASGATIGVLPEAVLSAQTLATWQESIRRVPPPRGSRLRWILVGSGPTQQEDPPRNTAVLLDRLRGEILFSQDKQFRFNLTKELIRRWDLSDRLGEGPLDEYITPGHNTVIVETLIGRLAVLVCEDLTEVRDIGVVLRDHGVSHLLVPIFSQPIRKYRWEHNYATDHYYAVGSQTVVVNSQVIADPEPQNSEPIGMCLGINGLVELGDAESAEEVVVFRFTEDGVFRVAVLGSP